MTRKIYIAFYDDADGMDRESWNTFYTPWVAAWSESEARLKVAAAIEKDIVDSIKYQFKIDITTVTDSSTLRKEVLEELEYLRDRAKKKHIEIQTDEIE